MARSAEGFSPSGAQCAVEAVPHPGLFLAKSAESFEKKRVEFFLSAKKRKRVRKSVIAKGIESKHV